MNAAYKPNRFLGAALFIADESTVLTNKIVALTDRKTAVARDLYDCWYFLKADFPLNEKTKIWARENLIAETLKEIQTRIS